MELDVSAVQPDLVDVTVIICTRNRADQLGKVLESACHLSIPPDLSWELIVVDNGSSDNSSELARGYSGRLPLRTVREERPGLSIARNRGTAEARGNYICWTDDDVLLDPGWLSAYVTAFHKRPEAAVFGGRIVPALESPTPAWFAAAQHTWPITTVLSKRDFSGEISPATFEQGHAPYGANFAVRALEQKQYQYSSDLGVSPLHRRVGEETDLIYRILKAGGRGWWVPEASVTHVIPPRRQTLRYVYEYFFLTGETSAHLSCERPNDNYMNGFRTSSVPAIRISPYLYRQILISALGFAFHQLTGNTTLKLRYLRDLGFFCGIFSYWQKRDGSAKVGRLANG
jgi:glycosyltransferase involved in cell wall biosynthesis